MTRRTDQNRVAEELSAIPGLPRGDLISRWTTAHGRPPPKGISRRLLEYSAAYQVQVKAFGGLKPTTRRKLQRAAATPNQAEKPTASPRKSDSLAPGTRLVREWHGHIHHVEVIDGGFRYDGEVYRSLSKVAQVITGARWSGPRFFGL